MHSMDEEYHERYKGKGGQFESINSNQEGGSGPQKSIEGWLIIVTNVHEEATEDDFYDEFSKYGVIKNLHLNMDRKTGFVKGYAFVEYAEYQQANAAIQAYSDPRKCEFLGKKIVVDWAIKKPNKKNR